MQPFSTGINRKKLPMASSFSLTKIDNESWDLMPNHTNLIETAHAATNAVTLIGKEILEAIIR